MDNATNHDRLRADLALLLQSADARDLPVPGFPSGDAFLAWAREREGSGVSTVLAEALKSEEREAVRYLLESTLRSLGYPLDEYRGMAASERMERLIATTKKSAHDIARSIDRLADISLEEWLSEQSGDASQPEGAGQ